MKLWGVILLVTTKGVPVVIIEEKKKGMCFLGEEGKYMDTEFF